MHKLSITIDETAQLSPHTPHSPQPKVSFDDPEFSHLTTQSVQSEPTRHGFFSEFEIISPPTLQSAYSIQSLKPGPDETYTQKYTKNCTLSSVLPIAGWLPQYKLSWLKPDFFAAMTVSILQVPQVLAYAVLAGLPPEWGLYASVVPVLLYGVWSTSTKVAVGPGAPSAIMLASAVNQIMADLDSTDQEQYQSIAMTFTFCCGIIFLTLGVLRAGFVIVFLSRPVMTGFIMSAALIIVLSQCRSLFGLEIGRYPLFTSNLYAVIFNFHTIHWYTTLISMLSLSVLFLPKLCSRIPKWVPFPLIVMIINIVLSYVFDFESLGVDIVGADIKAGFAVPAAPDFKYLRVVFLPALVVTVVDYMSNIVLANSFEQKMRDEYNNSKEHKLAPVDINVDANMEFFAYGIANLFGSFFSSQLISASFSRTALNYEMNGQTRLAGFLRVVLCVLCLLFLMPFLSPLPKCVLAAVVWTAVYRLIRSGIVELKFLFCVSRLELIEFGVAVAAPLVIGMELGIFLAIATSIIVNLLRHTFAKVVFLGELTTTNKKSGCNTKEYVDCELFKECKVIPHVVVIEMKAELSFANNLRLVNKIRQLLAAEEKYIIVSLNLTSFIDTSTIRQIVTLFQDAQNAYICLSQCRSKVIELIRRYQLKINDKFPPNVKTFISTHDAVIYLQRMRQIHVDNAVDEVSLTSQCSLGIGGGEDTETSDSDSSLFHENNV